MKNINSHFDYGEEFDNLDIILGTCRYIQNDRNILEPMFKVMEEAGELSKEVAIQTGNSYKEPDKDGVFGEAIDLIIASVDVIYQDNPNITKMEIQAKIIEKLRKWESNYEKTLL